MNAIEYLDIYDENMNPIGYTSRKEVHKKGYWHLTFQCWIISICGDNKYILFQKRHWNKKTFPNYFDVSAAGHLCYGEKVEDGIRELEEELGLKVNFNDLIPIGIIKQQHAEDTFIDNEFCNVFLYVCNKPLKEYLLQEDEVSALISLNIHSFNSLIIGKKSRILGKGIKFNENNEIIDVTECIELNNIVPHGTEYYLKVISVASKL